jgi:hypothetical protein
MFNILYLLFFNLLSFFQVCNKNILILYKMYKYNCCFCGKKFKEETYFNIHMEKNLCTFISTTSNIDINSYLYYLNNKKNRSNSLKLHMIKV